MRNFTQEKIGCHRHEFLRASCNASKASTPMNARQLHSKFFSRNSVYDQQAKEHRESNEREREIHYVWFKDAWVLVVAIEICCCCSPYVACGWLCSLQHLGDTFCHGRSTLCHRLWRECFLQDRWWSNPPHWMTAPSWWRPKKQHKAGSIEAPPPPLHHDFRLLEAAGSPDLKLAQHIEKEEEEDEFQEGCSQHEVGSPDRKHPGPPSSVGSSSLLQFDLQSLLPRLYNKKMMMLLLETMGWFSFSFCEILHKAKELQTDRQTEIFSASAVPND